MTDKTLEEMITDFEEKKKLYDEILKHIQAIQLLTVRIEQSLKTLEEKTNDKS
jgi:hypothetical protein